MTAAGGTVGRDAAETGAEIGAEIAVETVAQGTVRTRAAAGDAMDANAVRSRRYPSFCARVRRSWFKSQRSRSHERARGSLRTSQCLDGFWFICPRSSISVSHER